MSGQPRCKRAKTKRTTRFDFQELQIRKDKATVQKECIREIRDFVKHINATIEGISHFCIPKTHFQRYNDLVRDYASFWDDRGALKDALWHARIEGTGNWVVLGPNAHGLSLFPCSLYVYSEHAPRPKDAALQTLVESVRPDSAPKNAVVVTCDENYKYTSKELYWFYKFCPRDPIVTLLKKVNTFFLDMDTKYLPYDTCGFVQVLNLASMIGYFRLPNIIKKKRGSVASIQSKDTPT